MSVARELLKRCLDFMLDAGANLNPLFKEVNDVLLAQPEQEPVAWRYDWNTVEEEEYGETRYDCLTRAEAITHNRAITNVRPLYTAPPKREPLSDEEIAILWGDKYSGKTFMVRNFARAIEKAHGIGVDDER